MGNAAGGRTREAMSTAPDPAVHAVEREPQRACADAVADQRMDDVLHEAPGDRDDRLLGAIGSMRYAGCDRAAAGTMKASAQARGPSA